MQDFSDDAIHLSFFVALVGAEIFPLTCMKSTVKEMRQC